MLYEEATKEKRLSQTRVTQGGMFMLMTKGKLAVLLLALVVVTASAGEPGLAKPAAADKPPALIGQIFIVGNTKTASSIILEAAQLYPGAVLKYPDLQQAERNLRKLGVFEDDPAKGIHPTVLVMDPNDDSPYKDILIQVQEKK
jgi:hypothetical protein